MVKIPTVHDLLQDPTLSFADFCFITSALGRGHREDEIWGMPELLHLRLTVGPPHREPDPSEHPRTKNCPGATGCLLDSRLGIKGNSE